MTEEFLPCPFCGKHSAITIVFAYQMNELKFFKNDRAVCCNFKKGGCGAHSGYSNTEEGAIYKWNMRHK